MKKNDLIENKIISLNQALRNLPEVKINDFLVEKMRRGKFLERDWEEIPFPSLKVGTRVRITSRKRELVALAELLANDNKEEKGRDKNKDWKLLRVFQA